MDTIKLLTMVLMIIGVTMGCLLMILLLLYYKKKNEEKKLMNADQIGVDGKPLANAEGKSVPKTKTYTLENVSKFMEFATITDNMIVVKEGLKYIMVVECQGINYDLMSETEKNGIEQGFVEFLNTIRYPVQIYTQTRTVNLEDSITNYTKKVDAIQLEYEKLHAQYNQAVKSERFTEQQLNQMYFELTKQRNLLEYGRDIIYTTQRMSQNKNVLDKKYYVVIPYYIENVLDSHYSKDEKKDQAFSELYTRAQATIRSLAVCGVNGEILTSEELAELLYVAYNRDEAEVFGIDKAIKAGYDELYSTAEDVLDKKMRSLDDQIADAALKKAKEVVNEVRSDKEKALREKQENQEDYISELAKMVIEQNDKIIGEDVADEARSRIDREAKEKRKEVSK